MFWKLLLVAAAFGVAYYRWSRRRLYRLAAELPCLPNNYPIIGHAHMFMGNSEDRMKTLQNIGRLSSQHGGLLTSWLGNRLFICMTDPACIEVVSKACLDKDEFTIKFTRTAVGFGSIFAPGAGGVDAGLVVLALVPSINIWHPRRKINAPFFKLKNLNKIVPVFDKQSSIMVDLMRTEIGRDFLIWKYVTTYTFDSVCDTAVGIKVNSQGNPDHCLLQAIDEGSHMISKRALQPWLHPDFVYEKLPVYKQFQELMQRLHSFIDGIVQKKRNGTEEKNSEDEWTSFLDVMIQSSKSMGKSYSDLELREEIMVMLIAGNDTSATATCFTAVLLSRYSDVQDKVQQELQEVFGDSERVVTAEDLPRLKYLEAVIKESMRLYPPVPVVVREVHKDMVLPSGTTLVDGTAVMFNIWGTHRNPAYWGEDAEQFRPERFLEEPLRHPAQFVPFSYSVRSCIGSKYAMLSTKTALANLLRRYRMLPPSGARAADLARPLPVKYDLMMKATDGFIVRIEERRSS